MSGCSRGVVDGKVCRLSISLSGGMPTRTSSERVSRSRAVETDQGSVRRDDDEEEVGVRQVMATTAGDGAGKPQQATLRLLSASQKGLLAI